jgi:hypothetical protein
MTDNHIYDMTKVEYRLIEMIPGLLTWSFILLFILFSVVNPTIVAYLVVFYTVYFAYEATSMVILIVICSRRVKKAVKTDWMARLAELHQNKGVDWERMFCAVIIPFANETEAVLRPTLQCIADNTYPANKKIVVLASEFRLEKGYDLAIKLKEEFKDAFFDILITRHQITSGEIVGKSSNENHAGRELYKYIEEKGIDPKNVIVTSNDSDGRENPNYMARLVYCYMTEDEPEKRIYQPLLMFFNNIWNVSIVSRIIATFSIEWQLAVALKPHRAQNFACYALCLDTLHKAGYWDPDIIPEDERIFWKVINYFGQDVKIVPLYVPITLDAVKATTYVRSLKEQYLQLRRWAWGASEISYSLPHVYKNKNIPLGLKFVYISQQLRKAFEWALTPFIIFFGLSIPSWINPKFSQNILSDSLPFILSRILTLTTIFLITVFYIEAIFAPKKPSEWNIFRVGFSVVQWIAFPFVSIAFSAIPALEAQTRLILGRPIAYKVTEKAQ